MAQSEFPTDSRFPLKDFRQQAQQLGLHLNCPNTLDTTELVQCFRNKTVKELIEHVSLQGLRLIFLLFSLRHEINTFHRPN